MSVCRYVGLGRGRSGAPQKMTTPAENDYAGRRRTVPSETSGPRIATLPPLRRVGLGQRLTHTPAQMSGGERQRVAIARAIVNRPSIVLADEPTGNLDSKSGEAVMDLLRELHTEGRTILIITHDRELAASLPRRVSMRDGSIESVELAPPVSVGAVR